MYTASTVVKRRIFRIFLVLLIVTIGACSVDLATVRHGEFLERAGTLASKDVVASVESKGLHQTLRLRASTGLTVEVRTLRPHTAPSEKLPVILVVGGLRTGKDAVDLVADLDDVACAAIDYPYRGPSELEGLRQIASAAPAIRRGFLDTPSALSLTLHWLLEQDWVDPDRIELLGASLGVPFAAVAGATDERFSRLWLIHGGADNQSWVEHAGRDEIESDWLRSIATWAALFISYGNSFDTAERMRDFAPRPLIIIAASDDDFVPKESQAPFIEIARDDNVELIWTEGLHITRRRPEVLTQLFEIVFSRVREESAAGVADPGS